MEANCVTGESCDYLFVKAKFFLFSNSIIVVRAEPSSRNLDFYLWQYGNVSEA